MASRNIITVVQTMAELGILKDLDYCCRYFHSRRIHRSGLSRKSAIDRKSHRRAKGISPQVLYRTYATGYLGQTPIEPYPSLYNILLSTRPT